MWGLSGNPWRSTAQVNCWQTLWRESNPKANRNCECGPRTLERNAKLAYWWLPKWCRFESRRSQRRNDKAGVPGNQKGNYPTCYIDWYPWLRSSDVDKQRYSTIWRRYLQSHATIWKPMAGSDPGVFQFLGQRPSQCPNCWHLLQADLGDLSLLGHSLTQCPGWWRMKYFD